MILYTICYRQSPELYYHNYQNKITLIILVSLTILISYYNFPLGLFAVITLISLYYPQHNYRIQEGFIDKTDKNIVDEEKENDKEEDPDEENLDEEDIEDDVLDDLDLENLNPEFYKKKPRPESKKEEDKPKSKQKKEDETTFIGDIRGVINDLDDTRSNMNAKEAIKKINDLLYKKHRNKFEEIINDDEDDSDSDAEEEDYY